MNHAAACRLLCVNRLVRTTYARKLQTLTQNPTSLEDHEREPKENTQVLKRIASW